MSAALEITEKEFDAQLFGSRGLATMLGWTLAYHTLRSKGSDPGFPDRVLARDRVIFVELKREGQKARHTQRKWLDGLALAGAEAYLWRPGDLDEIGTVLGRRWHFANEALGLLADGLNATWIPRSLWLPGVGRADQRADAR